MATETILNTLTQTIQDCLEQKMKDGFDANAQLSIEIARSVAKEIEARAKDYTDQEITEVKELIGTGGIDLAPFTDFISVLKEILDGDEDADGWQILNSLISDTATNKDAIISHTSSIELITTQLGSIQSTLTNHESRLAALEEMEHGGCGDECQDTILDHVNASMTAACKNVTTAVNAHTTTQTNSLLSAFNEEMDPIQTSILIDVNDTGNIVVSGKVNGHRPVRVRATLPNGEIHDVERADDNGYSVSSIADAGNINGVIKVHPLNADSQLIGSEVSLNFSAPDDGGDIPGAGDGAAL
jgi:hypothetical protein